MAHRASGYSVIALKVAIAASFFGFAEFFAATGFSNTITTGAIISTLAVVAVAGFFTIRANTAKIWRENYEGERERANSLDKKCTKLKEEMLAEKEEQQKLRHDLKNELAAANLRTDLTVHEAQEATRHDEMVLTLKALQQGQEAMKEVLSEMTKTLIQNGGNN